MKLFVRPFALLLFFENFRQSCGCGCNDSVDGVDFAYVAGCGCNNYKGYCNVAVENELETCECDGLTHNGNPTWFVCNSDCYGEPFRVDGQCVQCYEGHYFCSNTMNYPACCTCSGGTYASQGDPSCTSCDEGSYSDEGASSCTSCPVMTYSNESEASACYDCNQGYYTNLVQSTKQEPCPIGTYGMASISTKDMDCTANYKGANDPSQCTVDYPICINDGAYCSNVCAKCPEGQFSNVTASLSCYDAPAGSYANGYPSSQAYFCPVGSYSDSLDSPHCTLCPVGESTMKAGSASSGDCMACPNGVDPLTYACNSMMDDATNPYNDICWNRAQLLSLNNTAGVYDLYELMYTGQYGLQQSASKTINLIQEAAQTNSNVDLHGVNEHIKEMFNAPETWLQSTWNETTLESCAHNLILKMESDSALISLLAYQFVNVNSRLEWLAFWHCSGGTFGCAGSTLDACPAAQSCFRGMYSKLEPILTAPGGITSFGYSPKVDTGRFTPMYSTAFITKSLVENVNQLTDWEATKIIFEGYTNILNEIQETAYQTQSIEVQAINDTLQVSATQATVSLNSSYVQGNMFYEQSYYNFNMTNASALLVQEGPENYDELVKDCQREEKWDAAMKIIGATMDIAAACVDPAAAEKSVDKIGKSIDAVGKAASGGVEIAENFQSVVGLGKWDPDTEMPPLPSMNPNLDLNQLYYNGNSSEWYLGAQKNLSNALVTLSPAFWSSIYLQNVQVLGPTIEDPPDCTKYKDSIVESVNTYLANVKNFTNYGSAMTTAEMGLIPQLGNIATGLATIAATQKATEQLNVLVSDTAVPPIITAPSTFQSVLNSEYATRFEEATKEILGFNGALAFLTQQYVASFSIWQFCRSYEYANAGSSFTSKDVSCSDFSTKYLPSTTNFNDVINTMVSGNLNPPSSVSTLQSSMNQFAAQVSENPEAWGESSGSTSLSTVHTLTVFITNSVKNLYSGNLNDGTAYFSLTPSSDLLKASSYNVVGVNPMVINVQAYWRGVTSNGPNENVATTIDVFGPNFIYETKTGTRNAYQLPSFQTAEHPYFAESRSIEKTGFACTQKPVKISWPGLDKNLQFCNQDSGLDQPYPGVVGSNFLFPSLWSTWNITANPLTWDYFKFNNKLELAVTFQYVQSQTQPGNSDPLQSCALGCAKMIKEDNPLLGKEWCTESACKQCVVSNLTLPFCSCNSWTGDVTKCPANSTDMQYIKTSSYKITLKSNSNLLEHKTISGKTKYSDMNRFLKQNNNNKKKLKKNSKDKAKNKKPSKKTKRKKKKKKKKKNSYYLCKNFNKEIESALQEKCDVSMLKMKCDNKLSFNFKAKMYLNFELNESARATIKSDLESCINEYFTTEESDESFEKLFKETDSDYAIIKLDGEHIFSKGF